MPRKKTLPSHARDIEFLYEIGSIRYITRTWRQFLTPDFQNLTEHHFRVAWIALILANMEKVDSTDKILKMALFHDLAESRTGDVNFVQRQYVIRNETMGVEDILQGTVLNDEFLALWHEYEKKESIESHIVKDADNLDVDFELQEQKVKGNALGTDWREGRTKMLEDRLYTTSARKLYKELVRSNPHDWHNNARNQSGKRKKQK